MGVECAQILRRENDESSAVVEVGMGTGASDCASPIRLRSQSGESNDSKSTATVGYGRCGTDRSMFELVEPCGGTHVAAERADNLTVEAPRGDSPKNRTFAELAGRYNTRV
jgi:hypothetical protein